MKKIIIGVGCLAVILALVFLLRPSSEPTQMASEDVATTDVAAVAEVETETEVVPPAEEPILNIYSSRHYDTDERLYTGFTEATGIEVRRIEDKADALMARMEAEGANSPADVFLTTDAGRLWAAEQRGLLQSVQSETLEAFIPAHLRHPKNLWFGFSKRARVIFYDKTRVNPEDIASYLDLADEDFKGLVCTRSSSNIYMLSLMSAMIENHGKEAATAWAQGMYDNRARDPEGGDTDQLRGIVSGQCAIAVANTYYFARALRKDVSGLSGDENISKIGVVFPDQGGNGAHVNISGGGVAINAPHPENAEKFLEYLASAQAQTYFAAGNDEYPVITGVAPPSSVTNLGAFEEDTINLSIFGLNQAEAQAIYDSVGYK